MAELFEETERLKLRFIRAYERLLQLDLISQDDFDEVIDAIDRMDELSDEEFKQKLGRFATLDVETKAKRRGQTDGPTPSSGE